MNAQSIIIPFGEELLPARKLITPKFSCIYEHGRIRYLKYQGAEVIRMIYFAVRDQDWNTAPYIIQNEVIESNENGIVISYRSVHTLGNIHYEADIRILAKDEKLSFMVEGKALSSFNRNRIGICVLHPITDWRGTEVRVQKPDGKNYYAKFPDLVSPHQPFHHIKKMQCQTNGGTIAEFTFDGDIFETEDQRNWADSSYKTYSTPLDIPIPVRVIEGDSIQQNLELKLSGDGFGKEIEMSGFEKKIPFPKIGYDSNNNVPLTDFQIELLRQIPFDHYRVEIHISDPDWTVDFQQKITEAHRLGTQLELILYLSNEFKIQLANFLEIIKDESNMIVSILILDAQQPVSTDEMVLYAYSEIKRSYPEILVGYGTNGFFADVNRNRPKADYFDFVSFPLTPQVHASDTRSLIENLGQQDDLLQTARSFAANKIIHISPITFKIRSGSSDQAELPADYDPRQHTSFGAWWTINTIKNCAEAERLTFYQAIGYRGIIQNEKNGGDQSSLYNVLKTIKTFDPKWIIQNDSENYLEDKVVIENAKGERLEFLISKKDLENG